MKTAEANIRTALSGLISRAQEAQYAWERAEVLKRKRDRCPPEEVETHDRWIHEMREAGTEAVRDLSVQVAELVKLVERLNTEVLK